MSNTAFLPGGLPSKHGNSYELFSRAVLILSLTALFFSVTNLVVISAITVLALPLFPLLLFRQRVQSWLTVSLAMLLGYFFLLTLAYDPAALIQPDFYRRDGNVFITFLPVLILAQLRLEIDIKKLVQAFVLFSASLNIVFIGVFLLTGGTLFISEQGIYHFLFIAHNAAGGFLAMMAAFSLGLFMRQRSPLFLVAFLIHGWGLWLTDSRGSVLALLLAAVIVLLDTRRTWHRLILSVILAGHVLLGAWLYHAHYHQGITRDNVPAEFQHRGETLSDRLFNLWPRSIYLFLQSPVLGTGFGSFNDQPYELEGIQHLLMQNQTENKIHSPAHAHHSFYHVLAETGLMGLALLLFFLSHTRRFILKLEDPAVRGSLFFAFWVAVLSSFTEHRLFTPSQMLPFTILLGLIIAAQSRGRQYHRESYASPEPLKDREVS